MGVLVARMACQSANNYSLALSQCQVRKRILCAIAGVKSRKIGPQSRAMKPDLNACLNACLDACLGARLAGYRSAVRTINATPQTVIAMPTTMSGVNASLNISQASKAVDGGTRYIRLDTRVAAPR